MAISALLLSPPDFFSPSPSLDAPDEAEGRGVADERDDPERREVEMVRVMVLGPTGVLGSDVEESEEGGTVGEVEGAKEEAVGEAREETEEEEGEGEAPGSEGAMSDVLAAAVEG